MLVAGSQSMAFRPKSTLDYVQDGLVAMWDGIENAGRGIHDSSATVWKELVGVMPFTVSKGSCEWAVDSLVNSSGSNVTIGSKGGNENNKELLNWWESIGLFGNPSGNNYNLLSNYTLEMVIDCNATSGVVGLMFYSARGLYEFRSMTISGVKKLVFMPADNWNNSGTKGYNLQGVATSFSGVAMVSPGSKFYVNGANTMTASSGWPSNKPYNPAYATTFILTANSAMYSYRIYNRALGVEEVRHNCNVDKVRFGIA